MVGIFVLVLVSAALVAMALGSRQLKTTVDVNPHPVPAATDSAALETGRRLTHVYTCVGCHGEDLAGTLFVDGGPFMTLPAPNLTGSALTDEQWERAIRHGIGSDGRPLIIMPSEAFHGISNSDLGAMVGYLRSLLGVADSLPERSIGPIGRLVSSFQAEGLLSERRIEHSSPHPTGTPEPGAYYASFCAVCHGADLGGQMFAAGPESRWAPNLTLSETGLGSWSESDFRTALTQGRTPDGRALDPEFMPWPGFSNLTESEIDALWRHLRSVSPVARPRPDAG